MSNNLTIIQYNCGHTNAKASRALLDSFTAPQVLAIQEPAYNRYTKSTYCPKPYELAYEALPGTRVCFMIRRDVGVAQWSRRQYGPNVAALELDTKMGKLTVVNVYNPISHGPRIGEWPQIDKAIEEAQGEILLLGDFNTHHSEWGGRGVACDQSANHLLIETRRRELQLLTPEGLTTWRRGQQNTVIDLTFASYAISQRVAFCGPEERWALPQDHIPIRVSIDTEVNAGEQNAKRMRYALSRLDIDGLIKALRETGWQESPYPLQSLHEALVTHLPQHCPKARPSPRARPTWSSRATLLLVDARRARRRYTADQQQEDLRNYKDLSNQLKKEMHRTSRATWRRLVEDLTSNQQHPNNKGLWRLSRWSRRVAGKPHVDPHIPALRRHEGDEPTHNNEEKTRILAEKFFPAPPPLLPRTRDAGDDHTMPIVPSNIEVTEQEMEEVLTNLPMGKTPGPDGIPNEVLRALSTEIAAGLAHGTSKVFAEGKLPDQFKESITITLRKEGKKDYSVPGAYRPIALENTLAKVVEKVLANRLSHAAEEHALLTWTQMGARKERSTMSAIGLITSCVQTAWKAKPGCVVSMLSLDLAGAFDNVHPEKLTQILHQKGIPEWLVNMVACFTRARRTRVTYPGYESHWIQTDSGIPQGSPLSPILFLFFISGLLEKFLDPGSDVLGFGFVDDTNLLTWGDSAEDNCRRLNAAHSQCAAWASEHGAKFAPDKYQLIHFTRRRRHACEDLTSTIQINNHQVQVQDKAIRVLGVWLDPKLTWKEHITQAARKGLAASEALARLATATWGPSARNSRLLYTAVVRPTILYGSQEWSMRHDGRALAKATAAPIHKVQNECLRRVVGAYKRTPRAAVEREAQVMPIDLYMRVRGYQQAIRIKEHPVEHSIASAADKVWQRMRTARSSQVRPRLGRELQRAQAEERSQEIKEWKAWQAEQTKHLQLLRGKHATRKRAVRQNTNSTPPKEAVLVREWGDLTWRRAWEQLAHRHRGQSAMPAAVWRTPWKHDPRMLYEGLSKAEATALFLMRSEVIGLNAWLAAVYVPDISPRCACGWHAQTVRHVLMFCPRYERAQLLAACGTEQFSEILTQPARAKHAARWFVQQGILEQFRVAKEVASEVLEGYSAFLDAEKW